MTTKFNKAQLDELRASFGKIERMDPDSPNFQKMLTFLSVLPRPALEQLAQAKIKWVSMLANNNLRQMPL